MYHAAANSRQNHTIGDARYERNRSRIRPILPVHYLLSSREGCASHFELKILVSRSPFQNSFVHELRIKSATILIRHVQKVVELVFVGDGVGVVDLVAGVEVGEFGGMFLAVFVDEFVEFVEAHGFFCDAHIEEIGLIGHVIYQVLHHCFIAGFLHSPVKDDHFVGVAHAFGSEDAGRGASEEGEGGCPDAEAHEDGGEEHVEEYVPFAVPVQKRPLLNHRLKRVAAGVIRP
jgi:hypothetical protein